MVFCVARWQVYPRMIEKLMIAAKGVAMGAADVVPGVSGGTIALLTGIYPRLINAITSVDIHTLKLLFTGKIKNFWKAIDGNFVAPLLIGIACAFLLLAHPIKYAIKNHPIPTWSFFFGLIIASVLLVIKHMNEKKLRNAIWVIPGIIFGLWIGSMSSIAFGNNNLAIFIAGMLAICAMILPGISGSFILVLLGMYEILISAFANREIMVLLVFIFGAVIGLLTFSRVIKWALQKFYQPSLFFLSGLMLGSLVKVWPWKKTLDTHHFINTMPSSMEHPQTTLAIILMITAFILVISIDYLGNKFIKK